MKHDENDWYCFLILTLLVSMFTWFRYFLWGVGLRLRFFKLDDGGDNDNGFVVLGEDDDDGVVVVFGAVADDPLNVLIGFREEGGDLLKKGGLLSVLYLDRWENDSNSRLVLFIVSVFKGLFV